MIVKPETVLAWHRKGFRLLWTWRVRRGKPGRPSIPQEVRDLIRVISRNNPRWGAPRIHGELLKLGIEITHPRSPSTWSGTESRRPKPGGRSWVIVGVRLPSTGVASATNATQIRIWPGIPAPSQGRCRPDERQPRADTGSIVIGCGGRLWEFRRLD